MAALRQMYRFRDHLGYTALMRFYVPDATSGEDLAGALAGMSDLYLDGAFGPYTLPPAAVTWPDASEYGSVEDKVQMAVQDSNGFTHYFWIPGPDPGIFLSGGTVVDLTNSLVTTFASAVVADALTNSGGTYAQVVAGMRTFRRHKPRTVPAIPNPSP